MAPLKGQLTELEGAILTEVAHRENRTAFKVRRAFQLSRSAQWSGSAGAVYPAIRRLISAGILLADPVSDKRGTKRLSLTRRGEELLETWFCDAELACGVGLDPFRLRAGLWDYLPAERRDELITVVEATLKAQIRKLAAENVSDPVDQVQTQLAFELQVMRLRWIETFKSGTDNDAASLPPGYSTHKLS